MNIDRTAQLKLLGERLKQLRLAVGLSRTYLETHHGLNSNSLTSWEKGIKEIGTLRLFNYLNIFKQFGVDISIDAMLSDKDLTRTIHKTIAIKNHK